MGDLANMTDCDGRVNGHRLLRWLRSKAEMYGEAEADARAQSQPVLVAWNSSRRHLLSELADDLEHELTPPDYPEDDGDEAPPWMSGPHDPHKRSPGADDEDHAEDEQGHGPCDDCGRVAPLRTVQDNGMAWKACRECAGRAGDDTVDLDDPALTGGPEGA